MKVLSKITLTVCFIITALQTFAQQPESNKMGYLHFSWKKVATQMPDEWYASHDAKAVADNVVFCQQDIGGWAKNKPYHHPLSSKDSVDVIRLRSGIGATFDNNATITEMMFLGKVYSKLKDERYRKSFLKGFNYILEAQYPNGGWPQFYPFRKGKTVEYASHITYNDNAMVNVMTLLKEIAEDRPVFAALQISGDMKGKARRAFDKGVECMVRSQIRVNGQPTVWCAQHDEVTLEPANARAYELASFSGSESVGITMLLMDIKNPSENIIQAVHAAAKWFQANKIEGTRLDTVKDVNGRKNMVVVKDKNAPAIWARFYELNSGRPFFCDRDGVKKYSLAEIGHERRNGYSWYTYAPEKVLSRYPQWVKSISVATARDRTP